MNELERAYYDAAFAAEYPEFIAAKLQPQPQQAGMQATAAPTDRIGEIPRNPAQRALGYAGDVIDKLAAELDKVGITIPLPAGAGELHPTLKDVTLGDLGKVVKDMSYGFYPTKGKGTTSGLKPEALELLNAAPAAAAAKAGVKRAARAFRYDAGGKRVSNLLGE